MRVDSLLNPAPGEQLAVAALERAAEQPPYTACAPFTDSGQRSRAICNDRDDFEMAVWRQESGLGPPPPPPPAAPTSSVFGGSPRFDYVAQLSRAPTTRIATPGSADLSGGGGGHGASASAQGHAEYMRGQAARHSDDASLLGGHSSSLFYASALAYARSEKQHGVALHHHRSHGRWSPQGTATAAADNIRPQIFVAHPPIVAHGAMSTDKSGDYIRPPTSGSEHLLGQVVLRGSPESSSSSSSSSSPPSLSSTAFSDAGSSTSARSQTPGKRMRLLHSDAAEAAAAAVLSSLSGRTAVDEFDDEDDDEDELDPYAEAFAAAASAAAREARPAVSGASCLSAPCCSSSSLLPHPAVAASLSPSARYSPPMPRSANSSPSIATTGADDDRRGGAGSFHKRKSSRAPSVTPPSAAVDRAALRGGDGDTQQGSIRRHRARTPSSPAKSAGDEGSSSSSGSDCAPAQTAAAAAAIDVEDKPAVNWKSLEVPEEVWAKAQELYDKVKAMKKVQNRQPVRKRSAILAALMFILCRSHGYPRTFAEICTAANVTKRDIGMYYNLMKQVLDSEYTTIQRAKPSEFLQHWCAVLELPAWMADAAACIYDRADSLAIVQGKCPISVSAACIWLVVWAFNHRHALDNAGFTLPKDTPVTSTATPNLPCFAKSDTFVSCDQRDVCKTACVVIATLTSVFKLLLPHLSALVDGLLLEHL